MDGLKIKNKIDKDGFYCPCDTLYFNQWAKYFLLSVKKNAPWANVHFHIFDGTSEDKTFCERYNFTFTSEVTADDFAETTEKKKDFWVNMRFIRIPQIFDDNTKIMSVDADCLLVKNLSKEQFDRDMSVSWVTTAAKREQKSLGSAVGFSNDTARHKLAEKLWGYRYTPKFKWCLDQILMDELLDENVLASMDTRYSDYKMGDKSFIWTGKGPRKNKQNYQDMIKRIKGEMQ